MLGSRGAIEGANVLDLFAGTGAMGIEALSRGAAAATFVDVDGAAVAAIRANLDATGLGGQSRVVRAEAEAFLAGAGHEPWDLVLVDPPYGFDRWAALLEVLPATLAVLEAEAPVEPGPRWTGVRVKRYGGTVVTVVRRL